MAGGMLAPTAEAETAEPALVTLSWHLPLSPCVAPDPNPNIAPVLAVATARCSAALEPGPRARAPAGARPAVRGELGLEAAWLDPPEVRALAPNLSPASSVPSTCPAIARSSPARWPRPWRARFAIAAARSSSTPAWPRCTRASRCAWMSTAAPAPAARCRNLTMPEDRFERAQLLATHVVIATGVWFNDADPRPAATADAPGPRPIIRTFGEPLLNHVVRTPEVYGAPRRR